MLNESLQRTKIEAEEPIHRITQTFNELHRTLEIQKEAHENYLTKLAIFTKKQSENKLKPAQEENVTIHRQIYENITDNLKKEYQLYRVESSREFISSIKNLANIQLNYYENVGNELDILQKSIEESVISGLPTPAVIPSAPYYQPEIYNNNNYDPTVRTVTGQPIGRIVATKYIDSNENSATLLKESQYDDNQNDEIIVGV